MQMKQLPASDYSREVKAIFIVYSICFLIGTYTHAAGLVRHGFLAFPVPLAIGICWDALTLIDPLTVMLLRWKPKVGTRLALLVVASDICVNTGVYLAGCFGPPVPGMVPLTLFEQALFGLFVFVTGPVAYHSLRTHRVKLRNAATGSAT
jgi:hypothetical protein